MKSMTFEQMFAQVFKIEVPADSQAIRKEELVATSFNGRGSVAHNKCGCPGVRDLLPAVGGYWICHGCNGHVTAAVVQEIIDADAPRRAEFMAKAAQIAAKLVKPSHKKQAKGTRK